MATTKEFRSFFEPREIEYNDGSKCWYHGELWPILETMKAKIWDKHQNVVLITGRTGTGKSEFAIGCAKYVDPNFTLENIFWSTEELINVAASKENIFPPGTAFIFDEAREGTQSLNAMTETNRKMGLFLDTIRSRGYHIFLLQPSFFLFQKTIAIYAADILFHVEKKANDQFMESLKAGNLGRSNKEKPFERGYARIYDADQKHKLYVKGKELEDMNTSGCGFITFGRSKGIVDWEEYERRKTIAVAKMNEAFDKQVETKIDPRKEKIRFFKCKAYYLLNRKFEMSHNKIAEYFEEDAAGVGRLIQMREGELREKAGANLIEQNN